MTLKEYIFEIFKLSFCGKRNPVKRPKLLNMINYTAHLHDFPSLKFTDREMRQAYEDLPICGSSKGLYLPETQAEIDEQIELHWKKIYSYFRKIDVLRHYHIESDSVQRKLF